MKTTINFILDKSSSMLSVWDATINAFNEYADELKKDGNEYVVNLALFSTGPLEMPYQNVDLKELPALTKQIYRPNGATALYDAACEVMNKIVNAEGKQLVVIMTDGEENSSRECTEEQFKALKSDLEKKGNFTFVFMGANQDAWQTGGALGFAQANVATFNTTDVGLRSVSKNMAVATSALASCSGTSSNTFYTMSQKQDMEQTK